MIAASTVAASNVAADVATQAELDAHVPGAGTVTAAMLASTLDLSGKTLTLSAAQKASDYIEIRDEKSAGTAGGGFTSGAWQTRTLNTEHADTGNHASLSSNQITLAAGTYECDIIVPGYAVNTHKARLRNITDSTTTLVGTAARSASGGPDASTSSIIGRFTIASSKTFEVQHRCETTVATNGYGPASSFADEVEIYTVARFWKVG